MPEYRELIASFTTISRWLEAMQTAGTELNLQQIWADPTKKERKKFAAHSPAASGQVIPLDPKCKYKRGSQHAQQRIFPPPPFSGRDLVLQSVERTPRSLILDFGRLHFQIHLQTHTMAQIYSRQQWDVEICKVDEFNRGFKIGVAFDFGPYVLAFPTLDKIFTPHWAPSRDELPIRHADVYSDFAKFLEGLVEWMRNRWESDSVNMGGLAINVVREADIVFGGLGLSVFLTEYEVFRCPSRVARLCEAFWTFARRGHEDLKKLLQPCWHGFILAADQNQRLRYLSWLHVYGKQRTNLSARSKELYNEYLLVLDRYSSMNEDVTRSAECCLWDIFEPSFIRPAIQDKEIQLGHLIFGEEWQFLAWSPAEPKDPLTDALAGLEFPSNLIGPGKELLASSNRPSAEVLYSVVPVDEMEKETFQYTVMKTMTAARGPLEYCGMARLIKRQGAGQKEPIVSVCRLSEAIPHSLRMREIGGIERIGRDRKGAGKRKREHEDSLARGGWPSKIVRFDQPEADMQDVKENTEVEERPKKRRRSADLKLATEGSIYYEVRSTRSRTISVAPSADARLV
ncbi:uncharacterized protein B0H18DRAFT_1106829 [Fomitopsis serialis]|uniref:uncharacterized protein n=1 Tax=Fomitopsis serialis TaxID=139415 RepID=UPI002007314C|nr:uncharacterized protein B0H18DRAFT_1106829 [Neoantrodia serialis]KAH9918839.1 hypothetical protein B0H18DRAFT_1106829 [Neoantrodia serialis]